MKDNRDEVIKELEAKNAQYEQILEAALAEKSMKIQKIESGPVKHERKNYYRISGGFTGGGDLVEFTEDILFGAPAKNLEKGREVVVMGNAVIAILPEALEEKSKELPKFKLIKWEDIGGLKSQLGAIRESIELPLLNEKTAKEFGLEPVKGLLLSGPPGCGMLNIFNN